MCFDSLDLYRLYSNSGHLYTLYSEWFMKILPNLSFYTLYSNTTSTFSLLAPLMPLLITKPIILFLYRKRSTNVPSSTNLNFITFTDVGSFWETVLPISFCLSNKFKFLVEEGGGNCDCDSTSSMLGKLIISFKNIFSDEMYKKRRLPLERSSTKFVGWVEVENDAEGT